jgi:hypothetical protein
VWAVATSAGTIDEVISMTRDVTWGPNGSQDPARGYDDPSQGSGDDGHASVRLCFQDLTVQTLDVRTGSWSTLLEIHATCAVTTGPPVSEAAARSRRSDRRAQLFVLEHGQLVEQRHAR